jgi:phosphoinositide-3-kinase, regulatory subunit 4
MFLSLHSFPFSSYPRYAVRPYFKWSLYERLHAHPRLSASEKRFIAYQLTVALAHCHHVGVCHGDIKSENVHLTSWGWVMLCDTAFYKPPQIENEHPAAYDVYFDAGKRRRCYVAPERFLSPGEGEGKARRLKRLKTASDVFSLGCTVAELFLDGIPLFTRPGLLRYSKGGREGGEGGYYPSVLLSRIGRVCEQTEQMVKKMTQRTPEQRLTARSLK